MQTETSQCRGVAGQLKKQPYDVIQTLPYCMADNSRKLMKHGVCALAEVGSCIAGVGWVRRTGAGETTAFENYKIPTRHPSVHGGSRGISLGLFPSISRLHLKKVKSLMDFGMRRAPPSTPTYCYTYILRKRRAELE